MREPPPATGSLVSELSAVTASPVPSTRSPGAVGPSRVASTNSVASLVYAGRDPVTAGYRAPTTRDIPQLSLPPLRRRDDAVLDDYIEKLAPEFDNLEPTTGQDLQQSLDAVPSIFFDKDFNLDNPRVFDIVNEITDQDLDRLPDNTILQEKLTWYIDIVEVRLIQEIEQASGSFFATTSQFTKIEEQATRVTSGLRSMRASLESVEQTLVKQGVDAIQIHERLVNTKILYQALSQLSLVLLKLREAKSLIEGDRFPEAAGLLERVKELASGITGDDISDWVGEWKYPLCDLTKVAALQPPLDDIMHMEKRIGDHYRDLFSEILLADLQRHINVVPLGDTLKRLGRVLNSVRSQPHDQEYNRSYLAITSGLRDQLEQVIEGAMSAQAIEAAFSNYKDGVFKETKAVIKHHLPSGADIDSFGSGPGGRFRGADENSRALFANLSSLGPQEAEKMLLGIYTQLSELFRRVSSHQKLLLDLTSRTGSQPLDLGNLLESAVNSSEEYICRLLRARESQITTYQLPYFIRFYAATGIFMSECEGISGVYPGELSTFLHQETKRFIHNLAASDERELESAMDQDTWRKEEVPRATQGFVDMIVESGAVDPSSWLKLWSSVIEGEYSPPQVSKKPPPQNILVGNESFFVSKSMFKLISMTQDNLKMCCLLPQVTTDVANTILKLVRLFNQRAQHLILGAGAMRSGSGLKHITFRHMSLASECLRFIIALLPPVRKCLRRHLAVENVPLMQEFDALGRSLTEHQQEIHQKFTNLMTDKISQYCHAISTVNWSVNVTPANPYVLSMIKDISAVSRILDETLPKFSSQSILTSIFNIYKPKLLEAYTSLRISSLHEKDNILSDVAYFREKMSSVQAAQNLAGILYMTVEGFSAPGDGTPLGLSARSRAPTPATDTPIRTGAVGSRSESVSSEVTQHDQKRSLEIPSSHRSVPEHEEPRIDDSFISNAGNTSDFLAVPANDSAVTLDTLAGTQEPGREQLNSRMSRLFTDNLGETPSERSTDLSEKAATAPGGAVDVLPTDTTVGNDAHPSILPSKDTDSIETVGTDAGDVAVQGFGEQDAVLEDSTGFSSSTRPDIPYQLEATSKTEETSANESVSDTREAERSVPKETDPRKAEESVSKDAETTKAEETTVQGNVTSPDEALAKETEMHKEDQRVDDNVTKQAPEIVTSVHENPVNPVSDPKQVLQQDERKNQTEIPTSDYSTSDNDQKVQEHTSAEATQISIGSKEGSPSPALADGEKETTDVGDSETKKVPGPPSSVADQELTEAGVKEEVASHAPSVSSIPSSEVAEESATTGGGEGGTGIKYTSIAVAVDESAKTGDDEAGDALKNTSSHDTGEAANDRCRRNGSEIKDAAGASTMVVEESTTSAPSSRCQPVKVDEVENVKAVNDRTGNADAPTGQEPEQVSEAPHVQQEAQKGPSPAKKASSKKPLAKKKAKKKGKK